MGTGETVVLGGTVKTAKSHSESGIPVLKDIPYVGKYLFGMTKSTDWPALKLLVFLTPYVIETPEDMAREARRRKITSTRRTSGPRGGQDSKLADPVASSEMKERVSRKKDLEKAWREYREKLEEQQEVEARVTDERIQTETILETAHTDKAKPVGTLKVEERWRF